MLYVDNENITDARINLALEEYLLENLETEEDLLLFYINGPAVIIGRNQNTLEEINLDYVTQHNIQVVRRLSGGGAVYHDLGNLNFSFITRGQGENLQNFKKFTAPVITALNEMGIPAELNGRNDIVIGGRKISGNASYRTKRGVVSHGTLLFDADLEHLSDALQVKTSKIESKGIKSVRSRVTNIVEHLPEPVTIERFRQRLLLSIFRNLDPIPQYPLSSQEWQAIHTLSVDRYASWDWNYGRSPDFNIQKSKRFPFGEIDARIDVRRGRIAKIKFYGDFFGEECPDSLEKRLIGLRYRQDELTQGLTDLDPSCYFGEISPEELVDFLLQD